MWTSSRSVLKKFPLREMYYYKPMLMNPLISSIVRSTILGVLSPLKGFKKGKVEISL